MPNPVESVPNAWLPYMDGQIWEFTQEEYDAMPPFRPVYDVNKYPIGHTKMEWLVGGKYYVRFYTGEEIMKYGKNWDRVLAGWEKPSGGKNGV